jgi:hypothetical protein
MKVDVENVVRVQTIKPLVVIEGKIAPQQPINLYPGNGNQTFYDYPNPRARDLNLKALGPTELLPLTHTPPPLPTSVTKAGPKKP